MFLTEKEIVQLTGHKTRKAQKNWLAENNFKFFENATGKVIVPRAKAEKRTKAVRYTSRKVMEIGTAISNAEKFNANEIGVYLLLDGEEIVYVGKTTNLFSRIAQHQQSKKFDAFKLIRLTLDELDTWERELIAELLPKYNKSIVDAPQSE